MSIFRSCRTVILASLLCCSAAAHAASAACDAAWKAYGEMKDRSRMEPSQYVLTTEAAAVRAACGKSALPAPPGADEPPRVRVHRPPASRANPANGLAR